MERRRDGQTERLRDGKTPEVSNLLTVSRLSRKPCLMLQLLTLVALEAPGSCGELGDVDHENLATETDYIEQEQKEQEEQKQKQQQQERSP